MLSLGLTKNSDPKFKKQFERAYHVHFFFLPVINL